MIQVGKHYTIYMYTIHKPDNLAPIIIVGDMNMPAGFRIFPVLTALLIVSCMAGVVTAASIATDWKERVPAEGATFSGVMISSDNSRVYSGGYQMYFRTWDGKLHWGGRPGFVSKMSTDGNYVAYGYKNALVMLDKDGMEMWSRTTGGQIQAVAISANGSLVISADDKGNINSWSRNAEFVGRNESIFVKQLAISPQGTLVVATTDTGLQFMTPALGPVWSDTKNGSIDTDILISDDGSTIITSGGRQVSSHTNTGSLNWMNEVTQNAIISTACSYDCSVIVIGSQDSNIRALDRYGKVHWTYPVGQWVNSVAMSKDAKVIVGAGIDQNLYVLNNNGKLQTKKTMDSIIHTGALAVSGDGRRIVVADEYSLNGYTLLSGPDFVETYTPIPSTSVRYTDTPTTLPTTAPTTETTVVTTRVTPVPATTVPVTTTPKSPIDPVSALLAIGTGLSLVQWGRKQ